MFGFGQLIDILKKSPKKIVFYGGKRSAYFRGGVPSSCRYVPASDPCRRPGGDRCGGRGERL